MLAEVQAQGVGRPPGQQIAHHDQVAERLAHLRPSVLDHGHVQPQADEGLVAGDRLGLGDLALVMREDEILPAAVDVDRFAQEVRAHHRAFDMPAGSPGPPRALPGRLSRRLRLPQHEVEGIALVRIVG